jgi:hypothetical protein
VPCAATGRAPHRPSRYMGRVSVDAVEEPAVCERVCERDRGWERVCERECVRGETDSSKSVETVSGLQLIITERGRRAQCYGWAVSHERGTPLQYCPLQGPVDCRCPICNKKHSPRRTLQ